jgi:hypothetical protein
MHKPPCAPIFSGATHTSIHNTHNTHPQTTHTHTYTHLHALTHTDTYIQTHTDAHTNTHTHAHTLAKTDLGLHCFRHQVVGTHGYPLLHSTEQGRVVIQA